jgi:hypothetical protein
VRSGLTGPDLSVECNFPLQATAAGGAAAAARRRGHSRRRLRWRRRVRARPRRRPAASHRRRIGQEARAAQLMVMMALLLRALLLNEVALTAVAAVARRVVAAPPRSAATLVRTVDKAPRVGAPLVAGGDLFTAPVDQSAAAYAAWSRNLSLFRQRSTVDRSIYDLSELQWAAGAFVETQAMIHDRFLYDRAAGSWTVHRFLDDLRARYGGVDVVMLWHSYPNIGVDDRNQFEMLADLPGGLLGLSQLVAAFHAHGVRVLLCYNPWVRRAVLKPSGHK